MGRKCEQTYLGWNTQEVLMRMKHLFEVSVKVFVDRGIRHTGVYVAKFKDGGNCCVSKFEV